MKKQSYSKFKGFTLIEVAVTIMLLAILAATAGLATSGIDESADARLAQTTQAQLQAVVTQAAIRQETVPIALDGNAVANATRSYLGNTGGAAGGAIGFNSVGGGTYQLVINHSNRTVTYSVGNDGNVTVGGLGNFTHYTATNGAICRIGGQCF